jgi:ABC-type glycerol-3-phosphate transport system permease component
VNRRKRTDILLHLVLLAISALTLTPFAFVINNSLRTNSEMNHAFFGLPASVKSMVQVTWLKVTGRDARIETSELAGHASYSRSMARLWSDATRGYRFAWSVLRPYMLNTFFVCGMTVLGVIAIASISAYVFSRYHFPGHKILFLIILSFMMIPGILTLVPSFLWVKKLGLLNSPWVLILPYVAGGQIMAIFLFKGFFDGLPNELFESARLDGAGYFRLYWHIVLPLSRQIIAVVAIINTLSAWNNFLWPFITNSDDRYHVIASGLFNMSQTTVAANQSTMFAAYVIASVPLLILFIYATKPFMAGVTSGAFKA